jgi:hypothetical protein
VERPENRSLLGGWGALCYAVFRFLFSAKKLPHIIRLCMVLVAFEREIGITKDKTIESRALNRIAFKEVFL